MLGFAGQTSKTTQSKEIIESRVSKQVTQKLARVLAKQRNKTWKSGRAVVKETQSMREWAVRHRGKNKGMVQAFEEHARCLMATGATARAVREGLLLNATHFLSEGEVAVYASQVPKLDWFNKQREALGLESYLYTFMRIAGCEKIIQWGFDETSIDGHSTLNQWAMIMDGVKGEEGLDNPTTIVTLECAALLPGSEAQEVVDHIEEVWERGKRAVDNLRDELGPELRDILCPLRNGGVSLHKIYGMMHDTCNCANKVLPYRNHNPNPNPFPIHEPKPDPYL